jgi:probable selenium-dependent hydroxylase accessory protein YqeC
MKLLDALGLDGGIVCAVGAGGKKSLLHALAAAHPDASGRLGMTATARCTPPPQGLFGVCLGEPPEALPQALAATAATRVFYAGPQSRPGRFDGIDPAQVLELHRAHGFATTLVKADGARMRWIKAPGENEPVLVPGAELVLPVLSLRALGRLLDEKAAHRPERVAELTGTAPGAPIDEHTFIALLSHEQGSLRDCDGARVVPVLNMVDDEAALAAGLHIAAETLARCHRYERIVLACLRDPDQPRVWLCRR